MLWPFFLVIIFTHWCQWMYSADHKMSMSRSRPERLLSSPCFLSCVLSVPSFSRPPSSPHPCHLIILKGKVASGTSSSSSFSSSSFFALSFSSITWQNNNHRAAIPCTVMWIECMYVYAGGHVNAFCSYRCCQSSISLSGQQNVDDLLGIWVFRSRKSSRPPRYRICF